MVMDWIFVDSRLYRSGFDRLGMLASAMVGMRKDGNRLPHMR